MAFHCSVNGRGRRAGGGLATYIEIGIADDIHEVSVGDITGEVADDGPLLHGVVGGAKILSNGCLGEGESAQSTWEGCQPGRGRISHHLYPSSIRSKPLARTPLNQIIK